MTLDETARPTEEAAAAKTIPGDIGGVKGVPVPAPDVGDIGESWRRRGGILVFVLALVSFLAAAYWTATSLSGPFDVATSIMSATGLMSTETKPVDPELYGFLTKLHLAKVSFLATVAAFSVALLRYANILTMPLARYIELEERKNRKGDQGNTEALETLAKLIRNVDDQPKS